MWPQAAARSLGSSGRERVERGGHRGGRETVCVFSGTAPPPPVKGAFLCFSPVRATAGSVWSKETCSRTIPQRDGGAEFAADSDFVVVTANGVWQPPAN